MTQELFNNVGRMTLLKPTPPYFEETAKRIAFLENFAIDLNFGSSATFPLAKSLTVTGFIKTVNYGSFPFGKTIKSQTRRVCRFGSEFTQNDYQILRNNNLLATEFSSAVTLKGLTIPGVNVVGIVSAEIIQEYIFESNDTFGCELDGNTYIFGSVSALGRDLDEYSVRGKPCSYHFPVKALIIKPDNLRRLYSNTFEFQLSANIESFGIFCNNLDVSISGLYGKLSVSWTALSRIQNLKVDYYSVV